MTDDLQFKTSRPEPEPERTPEAASAPETTQTIGASDLEGWRAPQLEPASAGDVIQEAEPAPEPEAGGEPPPDPGAPPGRMSREIWWQQFQMAFKLPGLIDPDFRPLAIQPAEEPMAQEVAQAGYDLAEEFFPGLLELNDRWFKLAIVGQFLFGKVMLARAIFAEKQARQNRPPEPVQEQERDPPGDQQPEVMQ